MLEIPKIHHRVNSRRCIGVLSSGGDAPGMNAAIRAIVRYALAHQCRVKGILKGYSGLLSEQIIELNLSSVANIIQRGGTVLKTDRCEAFFHNKYRKKAAEILRQNGMDSLIVIGGDGSFAGAHLLEKETGFPTLGVPGTIDNDIPGSEDTIGFDTAVNTAIESIDRIRDTANSHDRIFLVEVMGRNSGFIGLQVGLGGGAETILLPENKLNMSEICATLDRSIRRGKTSSILVVSEGPKPGLANRVSDELKKRGYGSRVCILGHIQRGGAPSAHDRVLASVLGATAVAHLMSGESDAMVGIQNGKVVLVPLAKVVGKKKGVPRLTLELAHMLGI
ncbi:MAG: 6-phosphofructokinase [Bdellovibrio sp.]|nr:6-phosphofructokinase [Bdellovibrio sp.]